MRVPRDGWRCRWTWMVAAVAALVMPSRAWAQVTAYAFVPDNVPNMVTLIETSTRTVLTPAVPVPSSPIGIAPTLDGRKVYVTRQGSTAVACIDVATRTTVSIEVGATSGGIAITPDNRRVWVLLPDVDQVAIIDVDTNSLVTFGTPIVMTTPTDIVMAPDGQHAYITNVADGTVSIVDTGNYTLRVLNVGVLPTGIAISPDGQRLYVGDRFFNMVYPIDLTTDTIEAAVPVGDSPAALRVTPNGRFVYVANSESDTVTIIDTVPMPHTTRPVFVGDFPFGVALTPDGRHMYVTTSESGEIWVFDAATHQIIDVLTVGDLPMGLGNFIGPNIIVPDTQTLVIANDADLTARGFGRFVPFNGGILQLSGSWSTTRAISLLAAGGTLNTANADATIAGAVVGEGRLTKRGAGSLTLSGARHLGGTEVREGTLVLNSFHNGPVDVAAGAVLAGDGGRVAGNLVTVHTGGTLSPGRNGPGALHAQTLVLEAGASFVVQLNGTTPGVTYDRVSTGSARIDDAVLDVRPGLTFQAGSSFTILTRASGGSGTFAGLPEGAIFQAGGHTFRITYAGGSGRDIVLTVTNPAPTIHGPGEQTMVWNHVLGPLAFTVGDDLTPAAAIVVTAVSSNETLLPAAGIALGGTNATRTLTVTPSVNATGTTIITLTVSDGTLTTLYSFPLIVIAPSNAPPTIDGLTDQTTRVNDLMGPLAFRVGDDFTPLSALVVTASSSNEALVPDANLALGGADAARTLSITPVHDATGTAVITVRVFDGVEEEQQAFTLTVTPVPATPTYFLAEGATGAFFDTDILLANPNTVETPITLTFFTEAGTTVVERQTLPPMSYTRRRLDTIAGLENASGVSTQVTSSPGLALVVERTMRWGTNGYGAHAEKATAGAEHTWFFAEGSQGFFFTYFLLVNPQTTANTAHVTYLREGEPPLVREYPLKPLARLTIDAGADPGLVDRSFGAVVQFDQPGVAERAMYFGRDPLFTGGHESAGVTAPGRSWFLAEGATGGYFATFVLLANPSDRDAHATVTYLPSTGSPVVKAITVPAHGRVTRNVATEDPALESAAFGTRIDADVPIIVERAQYWPNPAQTWQDAHNSFGLTEAATRWGLAEGRVGGPEAYQTYILLANPGTETAETTVTFLRAGGRRRLSSTLRCRRGGDSTSP